MGCSSWAHTVISARKSFLYFCHIDGFMPFPSLPLFLPLYSSFFFSFFVYSVGRLLKGVFQLAPECYQRGQVFILVPHCSTLLSCPFLPFPFSSLSTLPLSLVSIALVGFLMGTFKLAPDRYKSGEIFIVAPHNSTLFLLPFLTFPFISSYLFFCL